MVQLGFRLNKKNSTPSRTFDPIKIEENSLKAVYSDLKSIKQRCISKLCLLKEVDHNQKL